MYALGVALQGASEHYPRPDAEGEPQGTRDYYKHNSEPKGFRKRAEVSKGNAVNIRVQRWLHICMRKAGRRCELDGACIESRKR